MFLFAPELVSYLAPRDLHRRAAYSICESSFFLLIMVVNIIMIYLFYTLCFVYKLGIVSMYLSQTAKRTIRYVIINKKERNSCKPGVGNSKPS